MLGSVSSLLLLSFAVSLDGFGAGITYGVRKIRIPAVSAVIIALCSGVVILLSMLLGTMLSGWLPPRAAQAAGALILIAIGLWALAQFVRGGESAEAGGAIVSERTAADPEGNAASSEVWKLEIRKWGIIIQILRTPSAADVDRSGVISKGEALLLGAALSLDAFGAGIGTALVGFPPLITALLIAASSGLFLWCGTKVGFRIAGWRWVKRLAALPGIILIAMGLFKLL